MLCVPQGGIDAVLGKEFVVRASFCYVGHAFAIAIVASVLLAVHDNDFVCVLDSGEAVRNDDGGAVGGERVEGLHDLSFGVCVQCRRRLVADQDGRYRYVRTVDVVAE